jgi:1-acyl-sn-glycerol-3-phosphate acyltransferase
LASTDLVKGSRYVLTSNHQSAIDPLIIGTQVPFSIWKRLGSLNYFTGNYSINLPVVGPFLVRCGCFPAKKHDYYPYGLEYAEKMLRSGQAILIFPEGRRTRPGESRAHHGVEVLAHEPNVMIIPVHLEWVGRKWWQRSFRIGVGKPFDGSKMTAEEILQRVYATPVR